VTGTAGVSPTLAAWLLAEPMRRVTIHGDAPGTFRVELYGRKGAVVARATATSLDGAIGEALESLVPSARRERP